MGDRKAYENVKGSRFFSHANPGRPNEKFIPLRQSTPITGRSAYRLNGSEARAKKLGHRIGISSPNPY